MSQSPYHLAKTFKRLKACSYEGVRGVMRIESGVSGPTLGITACTHGNEPSGLALIDYLLSDIQIERELTCGTLYLIVNNIRATEAYFDAATEEEGRRARYVDVNMNRLPKDALQSTSGAYEIQRVKELYPIWERFEFGLDVHSTLEKSDPMIISRGGEFHRDLVKGFPIRTLISNIDAVQIGKPAFSFYGAPAAKVFAIEAGQHTENESFERACACVLALLENLAMFPGVPAGGLYEYNEYYVERSIVFPDLSYDLIKDFKSLDPIREGELLAASTEGKEVRAPFDGHILMPTSRRGAEKDITEEVAFLSRPVQVHRAG